MTKKEKRQKKTEKKKKKRLGGGKEAGGGWGACGSRLVAGALEQTALAFFILKKRKC